MLTHEDMVEVRRVLKENPREFAVIDGEMCFVELVDPKWYALLGYEPEEKAEG